MSALPDKKWTVEEYLAFERASQEKHEFFGGEIYLMAGASRAHSLITGNLVTALNNALGERPCEVHPNDMRVNVSKRDYFYPDIVVVCDEPQVEDDIGDTLLNPTVIIEVLSPSTEQFDRGKKFQFYRRLTSLREYLLVSQDTPRIEHYVHQENDQWLFSDAVGLDAKLTLPALNCELALTDVYRRVSFEPETGE